MNISYNLYAADMDSQIPTYDVHGKNVSEALDELSRFLSHEISAGSSAIRIIHGRGTGKLRKEIQCWLQSYIKKGLVTAFRDSESPSQAGGVTIILL